MKQDTEQEKQTPPAPKGGMSDFCKALLATAIPLGVLGVVTAGLAVAGAWDSYGVVGFVALGLLGLAILASIGFAIARRGQIVGGIWAGIGIGFAVGVISLMVTCFAALYSM